MRSHLHLIRRAAWWVAAFAAVGVGALAGLDWHDAPRRLGWWTAGACLVAGLAWGMRAWLLPLLGCIALAVATLATSAPAPVGTGGVDEATGIDRVVPVFSISLVVGAVIGGPILLGAAIRSASRAWRRRQTPE